MSEAKDIVTELKCESFIGPRGHPMPCFYCDQDIEMETPHRHYMRVHPNGYQPFSLHMACFTVWMDLAKQKSNDAK